MITRTLYLLIYAGGLTAVLVSGCGGKVIVDGTGNEGGQGGSNSSGSGYDTTINTSVGGGVPTCGFPAPSGALEVCGSSSTGSGGTSTCSPIFCDEEKNLYQSDCTDTSCICSYVSADRRQTLSCTCTLAASCVSATPCCPFVPFSPT